MAHFFTTIDTGIGGTFQTESGGTFKRNQWVLSTGMGWDFAPEYAQMGLFYRF